MKPETDQLIRSYRLCFGSPAGYEVLKDLMAFCDFNKAFANRDGVVDVNNVLMQEGARQVFLRILNLATLSTEQVIDLYGGRVIRLLKENEDAA